MRYTTKNGFKPLLTLLILAIIAVILDIEFFENIIFFALVLLAIIYRKPQRALLDANSIITSLVDGVVVGIDKLENKICIRIEKSIYDPSAIIAPISSSVVSVEKKNGIYLSRTSSLSKDLNEKYKISFKSSKIIDVEIIPTALSIGGASIYSLKGQEIKTGEEIGFLMQGDVNIYLDNSVLLKIDIGDKLLSSQSVIATI